MNPERAGTKAGAYRFVTMEPRYNQTSRARHNHLPAANSRHRNTVETPYECNSETAPWPTRRDTRRRSSGFSRPGRTSISNGRGTIIARKISEGKARRSIKRGFGKHPYDQHQLSSHDQEVFPDRASIHVNAFWRVIMNWDQIAGNWKQLAGAVKEKWGKLTDSELTAVAGKRDQLAGLLQERYGLQKEQADLQADQFAKSLQAEGIKNSIEKAQLPSEPAPKAN